MWPCCGQRGYGFDCGSPKLRGLHDCDEKYRAADDVARLGRHRMFGVCQAQVCFEADASYRGNTESLPGEHAFAVAGLNDGARQSCMRGAFGRIAEDAVREEGL